MFPVRPEESDQMAVSPAFVESLMSKVVPGISGYEVAHVTPYKVHQRVAKTFRLGQVLLAGDAAHINNPLGGMGMNGGIHDAMNLTTRLADVWHGSSPEIELSKYDRERRRVTLEHIQTQSIRNKRNLESDGIEFGRTLGHIAADPVRTREYLLSVSMIASLKRAAELGGAP
jgi:3-(3-hydroxy-phenyl)propionate hydroxylase